MSVDDIRARVLDLLTKTFGDAEWPRAAIAEHLDIAPRQVSNALRYWQRRGRVETYLSNDDNCPVWVAVYEYPSLTEIADPDGFWDTKL